MSIFLAFASIYPDKEVLLYFILPIKMKWMAFVYAAMALYYFFAYYSYLQGQSAAFNNARIAKGNFGKDKNWALAQALVNLVVSIIAGHYLGLTL